MHLQDFARFGSGTEWPAKIKADDGLKEIPIVFLTAKTDKFNVGMGKVMAKDYIGKPFDISDLDKRIKKVLVQKWVKV